MIYYMTSGVGILVLGCGHIGDKVKMRRLLISSSQERLGQSEGKGDKNI